jgi:hypothetical protein
MVECYVPLSSAKLRCCGRLSVQRVRFKAVNAYLSGIKGKQSLYYYQIILASGSTTAPHTYATPELLGELFPGADGIPLANLEPWQGSNTDSPER